MIKLFFFVLIIATQTGNAASEKTNFNFLAIPVQKNESQAPVSRRQTLTPLDLKRVSLATHRLMSNETSHADKATATTAMTPTHALTQNLMSAKSSAYRVSPKQTEEEKKMRTKVHEQNQYIKALEEELDLLRTQNQRQLMTIARLRRKLKESQEKYHEQRTEMIRRSPALMLESVRIETHNHLCKTPPNVLPSITPPPRK